MYFRKEVLLASRMTCLQRAWAIFRFFAVSSTSLQLGAVAFLSIAFLWATALLQSSLNQVLFFLGKVDNFGMFLSEISRSSSVKCSGVLFGVFWLRRFLHSSEWFSQFAFLKLYLKGGIDLTGTFDSKRMGKWSEPWVSSRTDHLREGAKEGVQRDRSNEDNFKFIEFWYVGMSSFKRKVSFLESRSSTTLPLRSRVSSLYHRGLWALKSPTISRGLGSWSWRSTNWFRVGLSPGGR